MLSIAEFLDALPTQTPYPARGPHAAAARLWVVLVTTALVLALTLGESLVSVLFGAPIEGLPKRLEIDLGGVKLEMVRIDPGEFWMGSPDEEIELLLRQDEAAKPNWFDPQRPRHKVKITQPFYLGKYEVTQEQYTRVTGKKNPSHFCATGGGKAKVPADTRLFPVENVSWDEANAFCDQLMKQAGDKLPAGLRSRGYKFHLPTEAQWEYACRAGTETAFHFGAKLNGDKANCLGDFPFGTEERGKTLERTCKVGSYEPNAWGLYDMHGNVCEWCQDWWAEKFYMDGNNKDPVNLKKDDGHFRIHRGGSWSRKAWNCRAGNRIGQGGSDHSSGVGLRAALRLD
jgi:formylglycine-generating enzyme required for sulfatase activity